MRKNDATRLRSRAAGGLDRIEADREMLTAFILQTKGIGHGKKPESFNCTHVKKKLEAVAGYRFGTGLFNASDRF
ncbi:hypothetical protein BPA01_47650 [Brevibacillus parabrevis]|uniref:Uncharacterized protein n=1 Tax=Brevibacillus parabrevis TaxID=54914 RepID=A0A4Y3PQJ7_BREPA|nr:hypothetical protein BPA01_47650 [Brevibacillus parabrevis]